MTRVLLELPGGTELELDDGVLAPTRSQLARLGTAPPARMAFAAAHLVMLPSYRQTAHSPQAPGRPDDILGHVDWATTRALRARLDRLGFGIAEAMDTAQRFEIGWPVASRLIDLCRRLAPANGFIAGAGVDHLPEVRSRADLIEGVVFQARYIQRSGGWPIVLPMPWLCEQGAEEADYVEVYGEIFRQLEGPLFVHWLGAMFHPGLEGYFPGESFLRVMALAPDKVRGAKLSMLDPQLEHGLRTALLERDQLLLTGDDLNFARLMRGGDPAQDAEAPPPLRWTQVGGRRVALGDFSHALLGVLDAVAEPASLALQLLAHGRSRAALRVLEPCERLGRKLFEPPTQHYKAGLAFLAWLNGQQDERTLVNRQERSRPREHLVEVARLASRAGAISDAGLAAERLRALVRK
jgi:hypothetical protein